MFNKKIAVIGGILMCLNTSVWGSTVGGKKSYNYKDTNAPQEALSNGLFCEAIDSELGGHLPPTSEKTYFCKNGGIVGTEELKEALEKITIHTCQKDTQQQHVGYQRCMTKFNEIEGCTGMGPQSNADKNKKTGNATIIYNPVNNCIVSAFPPATVHSNSPCSDDCQG